MRIRFNEGEYPLTAKWKRKICSLAYNFGADINECIQEALILEWEIKNKITNFAHCENYFKKALYRRISGYKSDWWATERVVLEDRDCIDEVAFDALIISKDFDLLLYEEMVAQISQMLVEMDSIASEIFLLKIKENLRWRDIKEKYYPQVAHNYFYLLVKLIRQTVLREVQLCKC